MATPAEMDIRPALPKGGQRYKDKVTIVTGGSKGIGEGCVRVFVSEGSKVVFCARGEVEGRQKQDEINALGHTGEAFFISCDLTQEDQIKNLVDKTVEKYGRIDCVINNAGWHPNHKPIDDWSANELRELFNMNVVSYFLTSKFAMPYLRKTQGNIINDSSLVSLIGQVGAAPYVTTKGAITSMTRALAVDEAKFHVRVNTISPGNVWTPMWAGLAEASEDAAAFIQAGTDAQLLGRFGTIEESGYLCLYLAAEGTFLTGVDIPLSGGAELNYGKKSRTRAGAGVYD